MTFKPPVLPPHNFLFVYGTLRKGFRLHHHLLRLSAIFIETGKVPGELFDLGRYPGARPLEAGNRWLHGEIYELSDPASDLKVLDGVEDFKPSQPERSEFIRGLTPVTASDGDIKTAWIYWLATRPQPQSIRIESGDYASSQFALRAR